GQVTIGGQVALRSMGFQKLPIVNVESACATGALALHMAVSYVRSGAADVALAVGVELLNAAPRGQGMELFAGGTDVADPDGLRPTRRELATSEEFDAEDTGPRTVFMDIYAAVARAHMRLYGTTQEQMAIAAAKNHRHAVANELAHFRTAMSVD